MKKKEKSRKHGILQICYLYGGEVGCRDCSCLKVYNGFLFAWCQSLFLNFVSLKSYNSSFLFMLHCSVLNFVKSIWFKLKSSFTSFSKHAGFPEIWQILLNDWCNRCKLCHATILEKKDESGTLGWIREREKILKAFSCNCVY